jgi:hypothetical protein
MRSSRWTRIVRLAVVIAGLLCATAQAQQQNDPAPATDRGDGGPTDRVLSKEDEELVKDLALLERMDLLRNLELFEDPKVPDKGEQRQQ